MNENMKIINMICPKCGASLKIEIDKEKAVCEYCGHQVLIDIQDKPEEIYKKAKLKSKGYHMGKMEAEELMLERKKRKSLKMKLCVIGVFLAIGIIGMLVQHFSKEKINPFDCVNVSFEGTDGEGELIIETSSTDDVDAGKINVQASKERRLAEGEKITVTISSTYYRLEEEKRTYIVSGLDEYLTDIDDVTDEMEQLIHTKSESAFNIYIEKSEYDIEHINTYLLTDKKRCNKLYDVFLVKFHTDIGEAHYYMVACYEDVIKRGNEEKYLDMSAGYCEGNLIHVEVGVGIIGFYSEEEVKAHILSSQEKAMEIMERGR